MKSHPSRREFLKASMATACAAPLASVSPEAIGLVAGPSSNDGRIKKAIQIDMLPKTLSYADRFKLARDVGFEGVEGQTVDDPKVADEIKTASEGAGLPIHSVMNMAHWKFPLSSREPEVVKKSLDGMTTSLQNAGLGGAEAVLLVPGVLDADTSYHDAWTRSQTNIRTLIPLAKKLKVTIAIEEVWNKFLLSPLEMARYVDEFRSPWVRQYFDVGNVVLYGYPQDWIRTQGKRIAKVHLKDFKMGKGWSPITAQFVNLGDGDIDWTAVRKSFADVGYTGWATTELEGGDELYLRDVVQRIDKLVLGL
jgi:L-ribulose-5-phosphate 3-epimerase